MQRTLPVVILAAAALTGCGGGDGDKTARPAQAAAKQSIADQIAGFQFVPEDIVVKAGGTVTWTNRDKAPHTAETGAGVRGGFDTGRLDQGQSKKIRFDKPGKVRFYCVYHRFMVGTVDVRK
jgi:plastocyanin